MIHPFEGILGRGDLGSPGSADTSPADPRSVSRREMLKRAVAVGCGTGMLALRPQRALATARTAEGGGITAGIHIDANGVVKRQLIDERSKLLSRQRLAAARASRDADAAKSSELRKISLNRLGAALRKNLAENRGPTGEMFGLAGMTQLEYVFFYPKSKDIVIAGPAEPYFTDAAGIARGIDSLQPILRLDHLAVALRAFPPGKRGAPLIGCSIDPTPEGLARMQQFLRQIGTRATPANTAFIINGLRDSLGMQKVSVTGVPGNTSFASVLVSADYIMKLIGIGLERPPVRMSTYIDAARGGSRNALVRWYFTPDYESVRVTQDRLAMELMGNGVKLIGEDELVTADGSRRATAGADRASRLFVQSFTRKYPEIAARMPVFAYLRNLIDLAIAAAFIHQQNFCERAGWTMPVLGSEEKLQINTQHVPRQVATAVNAVWKGSRLLTPIGGGVSIRPGHAVRKAAILENPPAELDRYQDIANLDADQWWWD